MPRKKLGVGDKVFIPMEDGSVSMAEVSGFTLTVKDAKGEEASYNEADLFLTMRAAVNFMVGHFSVKVELPRARRGRPKKEEPQNENTAPVV